MDQGGYADRDESARGAHQQHVAGADAPQPHGLNDGGYAADQQGGEHCPGNIAVGLARNPGHNDYGNCHGSQGERRGLKADSYGNRGRGIIFRFVADVFVSRTRRQPFAPLL